MKFLNELQNLMARYKAGDAFRQHVDKRLPLIIAMLAVCVPATPRLTVGTILFLGGKRPILIVLGLIATPFLLVGSLLVQLFVFFSWLEERAIAGIAGRAAKRPPIPAVPAAIFLAVPFIALALLAPKAALG